MKKIINDTKNLEIKRNDKMNTQNIAKYMFTICVPTYNRGKKTLLLVESIINDMRDDWSILILDNASIQEQEYYCKVEGLANTDNRIRYVRHQFNRQFHGNYLACFEHANSDYIMITSDEDIPILDKMDEILKAFIIYDNLGIIRCSGKGGPNMLTFEDCFFEAGEEALLGYGLMNNYISGTIYNIDLIKKYPILNNLQKNLDKHAIYPHLYVELLISYHCSIIVSSEICITEGEPQKVINDSGTGVMNNPNNYKEPYSLGSRLDQFIHLRDALLEIKKINMSDKLFFELYIKLVQKYYHLIGFVNMPMYENSRINKHLALNCMYNISIGSIMSFMNSDSELNYIIEAISNIHNTIDARI